MTDDSPAKSMSAESAMHWTMQAVKNFHDAFDVATALVPSVPDEATQTLRIKLIDEEVNDELLAELRKGKDADLGLLTDACADAIFVIIGTALAYGLPLAKVWSLVDRSNMAKVDPATRKVTKNEFGKVMKPPGWVAPDAEITALITDLQKAGGL